MSGSAATKLIEFLKPRLNRRSVAFLLCLVFSTLFWLLTSLSIEYVDEISIPVAYENLPENLLVANEPIKTVTAEVKGFGFDLLWHWFKFNEIQISVLANPASLPSVKKDGVEWHYMLSKEKTGKVSAIEDQQIELQRIFPDTLFLQFRPIYSKKVPVILDANVSFDKQFGFEDNPIIEPDSITITGLKSEVASIASVLTEQQVWTDLDESISAELPLVHNYNPRLVRYSSDKVQVAINVSQYTEGSVTIPLNVVSGKNESVKVFPSKVEVRYQLPLADYETVTAEMFRASVTIEPNNESPLLTVSIDETPIQVRQARVIPAQVEFIVQK